MNRTTRTPKDEYDDTFDKENYAQDEYEVIAENDARIVSESEKEER